MKRNRGRHKSAVLNPAVENYVFNFQLCPNSLQELSHFTGSVCESPVHLTNSILMNSAKKRWQEKGVRLYWVNSTQDKFGSVMVSKVILC